MVITEKVSSADDIARGFLSGGGLAAGLVDHNKLEKIHLLMNTLQLLLSSVRHVQNQHCKNPRTIISLPLAMAPHISDKCSNKLSSHCCYFLYTFLNSFIEEQHWQRFTVVNKSTDGGVLQQVNKQAQIVHSCVNQKCF